MLTIYGASAGSGKTFTLVKEYLRICLLSGKTDKYRNVLAITFTNKACNEMKERIIHTLNGFAGNEKTDTAMLALLAEETKKSEDDIRQFAREMLHKILQDYNGLSISTIDAFIHRVIRGFAWELELPHNFEVHLDKDELLDKIVENVLDEVTDDEKQSVTQALIEFTESKIDEGEGWNIEFALRSFTSELLREESFLYLEKIAGIPSEKIAELIKQLRITTKDYEQKINLFGAKINAVIEAKNLNESDFYFGKTGIYSFFKKLRNFPAVADFKFGSNAQKTLDEDKWTSSKDKSVVEKIEAAKNELRTLTNDVLAFVKANENRYYLAELIAKNINQIRVAEAISRAYMKVKEDENILPISEFQTVVYERVSIQKVEDIYERVGEKYDSILIDEFQDTSLLQFRNLVPLIGNAQSELGFSLIVGDAKQSIYRWKGGEAKQLIELLKGKIYGSENDEWLREWETMIYNYKMEAKTLDKNFRSQKNIIEFNNDFYAVISAVSVDTKEIYENHTQQFSPEKTSGFVSVEAIENQRSKIKEQKSKTEESDAEVKNFSPDEDEIDAKAQRVLAILDDIKQFGYCAGDVAVLVRDNTRGAELAQILMSKNYQVETGESLLFSQSKEVNRLIALIQYLSDRKNKLYRYELLKQCGLSAENHFSENKKSLTGSYTEFDKIIAVFCGEKFNSYELMQQNLFDVCESAIRIFKLDAKNIFVSSFLDLVSEQQQWHNTFSDFIEWWNEVKMKKSIQQNGSPNAVKIMTIHKSKGLEFPVVIVPDADWKIKTSTKNVWVENIEGIEVSPLLLRVSSAMEKTQFAHLYEEEKMKSKADTVNLLYVATTRASERLYMLYEAGKMGKDFTQANHFLQLYLERKNADGNVFEFGDKQTAKIQKKKDQPSQTTPLFLHTNTRHKIYETRLKSATDKTLSEEQIAAGAAVVYGNKLHALIDLIASGGNAKLAAQKLALEEETTQTQLKNDIDFVLQHPQLSPYFSDDYTRLTEFEMLDEKGEIHKPDFIAINKQSKEISVLDFKTGKENSTHAKQVQDYISLLEKGNRKVANGYLVYTQEKRIEKM